ncbi:hypothetical protein DFH08DRAFT_952532 [Mycena albidolilacea]|uniref:Uncharacterized protein n=1 Tax=Mycena albidolilacea TaxID=1033008 RepID=A0AAD7F191_9AGAR|nr:hypothetical protein DFH08DRAFT_952532 [Mycena albidolilacea]
MPATNQTPQTSACGLPLPLPTDFDFHTYRKTPAELISPDDISLREKNTDNCLVEHSNNVSLRLTRVYEAAAGSSAGVGNLDVGTCLQPFISYSKEEKVLLFASKDVVEVSGPLPLYMTMWVAGQCVMVVKAESEEKKKHNELEANPAGQMLRGAIGPMHHISSLAMLEVELPNVFLGCLVQKMPIPLHWWTKSNLTKVNNNSHWLPWKELTIKGKKLVIIMTDKVEKIVGNVDNKFKSLTPGKWREASINFTCTLHIISQEVLADAPPGWLNPAIEYEKHI